MRAEATRGVCVIPEIYPGDDECVASAYSERGRSRRRHGADQRGRLSPTPAAHEVVHPPVVLRVVEQL